MSSFCTLPKDERNKLDSKSRKCILLGYGTTTKGYRLYKCGFTDPSQAQKEQQPLVYLECSDEPSETIEPLEPVVRRSECERRLISMVTSVTCLMSRSQSLLVML